MNTKQTSWNSVDISIGGNIVKDNEPITYTQKQAKKEIKIIRNHFLGATTTTILKQLEFYYKRKSSYYFKDFNGDKFMIETDQTDMPFKKGEKYDISFNQ